MAKLDFTNKASLAVRHTVHSLGVEGLSLGPLGSARQEAAGQMDMLEDARALLDSVGERSFESKNKSREWHTAFYYLAEHVRYLSDGEINHKELYALVGTEGRFVNHENPTVRKRMAGALSRIVHSKRYAEDMRVSFLQDSLVFTKAASEVCARIGLIRKCSEVSLATYLEERCWPDVYVGLANERAEWRAELDMEKIAQEMRIICSRPLEGGCAVFQMASMFRLIAFGGLEITASRTLVDEYPTTQLVEEPPSAGGECGACLVKFADERRLAVAGSWVVAQDRLFTIGRYIDCDAIEAEPGLSRLHCCIYHKGGQWYFEDLGSRNGSVIERSRGMVVYSSGRDGVRVPVPLQFGDIIVLAGLSHYWFGALA